MSYDPWGQAREGTNWLAPIGPDAVDALGIGFTGHAARLDADLVDMGGRSYHPRLGRFFSHGTTAHAVSLAETLAEAWAAKLSRDFPTRRFDTRVVTDSQEGDVCVVFNQLPSMAQHE